MDAEQLIGTLIRGALGGRRKRSHGALRFLTGRQPLPAERRDAAGRRGVAWGLYETVTQQGAAPPRRVRVRAPCPRDRLAPASSVPPLPPSRATEGEAAR